MRAVLFLLLLALPLAAKESPEEILALLPEKIAGCEKGEYHRYEPAALGGSVPYGGPGLVVTVYAYDMGMENIATDLDDAVLQGTFRQAQAEIRLAMEKGDYSEVTDLNPKEKRSAFGTLVASFRVVRTNGDLKDKPLFSEVHVFGARGHVIKFRVSGEMAREKELRKILGTLLPEIRKALVQPKTPAKQR